MKQPLSLIAHAGILAMIGALAGCATTPDARTIAEAVPSVNVRLAPRHDIARHGIGASDDPLEAPMALLHQRDEFVPFVVELELPRAVSVSIDGAVRDPDGAEAARLYGPDELRDYWKARLSSTNRSLPRLLSAIDRHYVPKLDFNARRGRWEYYVMCIGKAPIPRPSTARISVTIDGGEPREFTFALEKTK
jgi:hypothetical protein